MAPVRVLSPATQTGSKWELSKISFNAEKVPELPYRCYIFLDASDYNAVKEYRDLLLTYFGVPGFVASRTCFESNGYFGHKATYEEKDGRKCATSCTTWFQCLCKMVQKIEQGTREAEPEYALDKDYQWYEMMVLSRWDFPGKCQILCVDVPFDLPERLQTAHEKRAASVDFRDPFAMHADLWDQMIVYWDISVWRVRDPVRQLEKSRLRPAEMFIPTHEFSRHAIHVSEVLQATSGTIMEMDRCRTEIYENLPELGDTYKCQAKEYARFQISLLKSLKLRSDANQARLASEINFAFNRLSRQDSRLIKSISLLTMVFLPASFVTAIFSTSFFNRSNNGWEASGSVWVLWVTIITATVAVLFLWQVTLAKDDRIQIFPKAWLRRDGRYRGWLNLARGKTVNEQP